MTETKFKELMKKSKNKWWLILGVLFFLGTSVSSIIRSADGLNFGEILYMSVDWFTACIIYFFIGAMFGHIIDYFRNRKIKHPLWFWLSLTFYVLSTAFAFIFASSEYVSIVGKILFPVAYGVFFIGMAYTLIFPSTIVTSYYGKLLFDILLFGVFASWLHLTLKNIKPILTKILLVIIFIVLFLGLYGCTKALS